MLMFPNERNSIFWLVFAIAGRLLIVNFISVSAPAQRPVWVSEKIEKPQDREEDVTTYNLELEAWTNLS